MIVHIISSTKIDFCFRTGIMLRLSSLHQAKATQESLNI